MDGPRNHARNDVTAVVAREFEPTRIEHQLLAQTFDLVCKGVIDSQEASTNSAMTNHTTTSAARHLPAGVDGARRRAA